MIRSFQALMIMLVLLGCADLQAQLFGRQRSLRQPLTKQGLDTAMEGVGQITGGERFVRGNRGRASFVGADRSEAQSFVGSEQARTSGVIVSSTAGISPPPDRSSQINRPVQQPRTGHMYLPKIRLEIGDETGGAPMLSHVAVTARVQKSVQLASRRPIAVLVEERTAILHGVVASESEKDLAVTLALFEPGISKVMNQLRVQQRLVPSPPEPLRPPR